MDSVDFFNIDIEQTDWATSSEELTKIRHRVFVEEQHVPEDMEMDQEDPDAVHWLAYGPNNQPIGTARMLTRGKIGRLAVLKEHRDKGIGSAIMRRIIRLATRQSLPELTLDSQLSAVTFYEVLGFERLGSEFMDAGIPHIHMRRQLTVAERHDVEALSNIDPSPNEDDRQRLAVDGAEVFLHRGIKLLERAERKVRIFTHNMDPLIYNNEAYCNRLYQLGTSHPQAEIKILVRDNHIIKTKSVALAELTKKLPSHISIRLLSKKQDQLQNDFLIVDNTGILYKQEQDRYRGYSVYHAPAEAKKLAEDFDTWWDHSLPDPELKRLHL